MSSDPTPDINQPPNDGIRARADTVASVTASSTVGSIVYPNPSTPNLERDGNVVDETPAGQDDIATPQIQPLSRVSISSHRTLNLGDRVEGIDEPKVPHHLAASAQIESGGTVSSSPSVVTHRSLAPSVHFGTNDPTEGVHPSPDSDPFEFDGSVSSESPVASHEPSIPSDQIGENDDANVAQHLSTSDQSYPDDTLPSNPDAVDPEDNVYSNVVQQSTISDQVESSGSHSTTATTTDSDENDDADVVQRSSTSEQSESTGSITADSTTVDTTTTPALTTPSPAEFSLNRFDTFVQALADLSPPATFDGDIVMPDDGELKLQIWQKGYKPSFGPQPAASNNKWAKSAKVEPFDMSKE